MAIYMNAHNSE